jgi:hypothetical protein
MRTRGIIACTLLAAAAVLSSCGANTSGSGAARQAVVAQAQGSQPAMAQAGGAGAQNSGAASASSAAGAAPAANATQAGSASQPNPAGDIPDSQTFVRYSPPDGRYAVEVPEGWARAVHAQDTSWEQQYDGVSLRVLAASRLPKAADITAAYLRSLDSNGGNVLITKVSERRMGGRTVVVANYSAESSPDPVTNKALRLDNEAYIFFDHGSLATLRLWAPAGADNVDQWRRISRSFAWK